MRDRIALGLLIAAVAAFASFNLLPWKPEVPKFDAGWKIWVEVFSPRNLRPGPNLLPITGILAGALIIVSGPFLVPVLRSSRLIWWTAAVVSGMAMVAFTGSLVVMVIRTNFQPGSGMCAVVVAQVLNFAGILSIRRLPPYLSLEAPKL